MYIMVCEELNIIIYKHLKQSVGKQAFPTDLVSIESSKNDLVSIESNKKALVSIESNKTWYL